MADVQVTFTWTIENFSFCYQKIGEGLCSPSFSFGSIENNWFLCLYPRGETEEKAEFIACFLHRAYIDECNFPFNYKLEILGASEKKLKTVRGSYESPLLYRWGSSEFLEIKHLAVGSRNNREEDVLTVRCQLFSITATNSPSTACAVRTRIDTNRIVFKMAPFYEYGIINSREQITFPGGGCFECIITYGNDVPEVKIVKLKSKYKLCHLVAMKLTFQLGEGPETCSQTARHFFQSENLPETWHFPDFSALVDCNENVHSCAKNTVTQLQWEFTASSGTKSNYMTKQIESNSVSPIDATSWQQDMRCIFLNKRHSDIKLRVENEVIDCHKVILASRSPVFSAMFEETMKDPLPIYDIVDISFDTLKLFMEFLYTDTVNEMNFKKAKKLLIAAATYQVLALEEKCFTFLSSLISVENVCEVLSTADRGHHDRLKSVAMDFIIVNAENILSSTNWQKWMKKNTKLATEVLSILKSNISIFQNAKSAIEQELMIKATTSAAESSTTARGSKYPSTSAASLLRGNQNPPSLNHASSGHKSETTVGYGNQNAASLNYASSGHKSETTLRNGNQNAASSEEHRHETLNPSENNVGKCPIDSGK